MAPEGFKPTSFSCLVLQNPHLQSSQVLQLGEVLELQIERVDADEGEDVQDVEEEPDDEHEDVVSEDHVVDDACNTSKQYGDDL